MLKREDYEVVSECSMIVLEYKQKMVELSQIDIDADRLKKEINIKIGEMKDPLGEDFLNFQTELNNKNTQFHLLTERKTELVKELEELRETEKEFMKEISKMENKDEILAKVVADAGIELKA